MLSKQIAVLGKRIPAWALVLLMIMSASAAVAAALAAPYAEVKVAVSQTVVIDESLGATGWDTANTKFDVYAWKGVGQGQYAKIIIMGQGNDYGWFKFVLKNLANDANLIKVYAENVPPELKVKFTKAGDTPGTYELFDASYAKIAASPDYVTIHMYVLIKPGTPQGNYEFNVVVEVLGS